MNLRDAAKQIVDYAPHVSRAQNPIPVPARMLADLAEALEAEARVKRLPYSTGPITFHTDSDSTPLPDAGTLHRAMFGE